VSGGPHASQGRHRAQPMASSSCATASWSRRWPRVAFSRLPGPAAESHRRCRTESDQRW